MAKGKEVETTRRGLPAVNYGEDAGAGMEGMGRDEMLIPFIRILQSNSPEVDENDAKHVPGAKAGMIINTATKELYDGPTGVVFVPCHRDHSYVEFINRDAGGGFVGTWAPDDQRIPELRKKQRDAAARRGFGKIKLDPDNEQSNELTETWSLFGELLGEMGAMASVVGFSSTQIRKYRQLMTQLAQVCGNPPRFPIFAFKLRLRTVPEKNKKGKFFGWKIGFDAEHWEDAMLAPDDSIYKQARELFAILREGGAKADYGTAAPPTEEEDAGGDPIEGGDPLEEEIPMS